MASTQQKDDDKDSSKWSQWVRDAKRELLKQALEAAEGNLARCADFMGVTRQRVNSLAADLGLRDYAAELRGGGRGEAPRGAETAPAGRGAPREAAEEQPPIGGLTEPPDPDPNAEGWIHPEDDEPSSDVVERFGLNAPERTDEERARWGLKPRSGRPPLAAIVDIADLAAARRVGENVEACLAAVERGESTVDLPHLHPMDGPGHPTVDEVPAEPSTDSLDPGDIDPDEAPEDEDEDEDEDENDSDFEPPASA